MLHLTLHYIDLCEPTVLCLSALSGSVENKTNLELCEHFLVFSWSIISRTFLLYREKPLFCPSSLKSGVWRAAKLLCRGVPSAFKTVRIESCCFTWRTAAQENLRVWTMPSSWLHQPSRKLRDLGMLKTWLLITEAGGRGTVTFKRRLKGGVLILKKLLQKSTEFFFFAVNIFFLHGDILSPQLPFDPLKIFFLSHHFSAFSSSGWRVKCVAHGLSTISFCCEAALACASRSHSPCSNPASSEASKETCGMVMFWVFLFVCLGLPQRLKIGT